jgi:hypothetical protein
MTYVWIHYARPRPHWYERSAAERQSLLDRWAAVAQVSREAGGEPLGRYHVRGQSDFETVEIWRFATAEAAFDHWSHLTAAGYNEWFAFANNIGLRDESPA